MKRYERCETPANMQVQRNRKDRQTSSPRRDSKRKKVQRDFTQLWYAMSEVEHLLLSIPKPSNHITSVSLVTKCSLARIPCISPKTALKEYSLEDKRTVYPKVRSPSLHKQYSQENSESKPLTSGSAEQNNCGKWTKATPNSKDSRSSSPLRRRENSSTVLPIATSPVSRSVGPRSPPEQREYFALPACKSASTIHQEPSVTNKRTAALKEADSVSSDHSLQMNTNKQRILQKSRERSKEKRIYDDFPNNKVSNDSSLQKPLPPPSDSLQSIPENEQSTNAIVKRMREFAWMCEQATPEQLHNEFDFLPQPSMQQCKACRAPENEKKNRYRNIPCLDSSRILLNILRPQGDCYIHANRIEYPTLRNRYIIAQGPLSHTVASFWEMIWQEDVYYVVMLCQNVEEGRRKCADYFSNTFEYVSVYGHFLVILKDQKWEDNFVKSSLRVGYNKKWRDITHYQYREWSDFKAPHDGSIIKLLQKVRGKSTVVVHCSAGVGRSGTFVAIEMCLQDLANGLTVNVYQVVKSLRQCRALAVQTFGQYLSIYKAVLEIGEKHGAITKQEVLRFYRFYDEEVET